MDIILARDDGPQDLSDAAAPDHHTAEPAVILRNVRESELSLLHAMRREALKKKSDTSTSLKRRLVLEDAYRTQALNGVHPETPSVSQFAIDRGARLELSKERRFAERNYLGAVRELALCRTALAAQQVVQLVKMHEEFLRALYLAESNGSRVHRARMNVRRFTILPDTNNLLLN